MKKLKIEPADVFINFQGTPPKWIWDQQLASGCFTLLAGKPKTGKSLFVRTLLRAFSKGESLLGFRCESVPTLYLALEENRFFLIEQLKKMEVKSSQTHIFVGSITDKIESVIEELREYVVQYEIKLIIIDPIVKFLRCRDVNEYAAIYYELTKISDLARDLDVHVLGVHHLGKSQTQSEEQILGSTAFFGASDGAFLITREKNMGRIRSNMRYGTSLEETYFTYDSNFLISAEGSASDVRTTDIRTRILEIISNAHGPIELSAILEKVEARSADVKRSLNQMVEESILIVEGSGFKGSPLKYSIPTLGNNRAEEKQGEP